MTRALAFDPGPNLCAWAYLEGEGDRVRYLAHGRAASDPARLAVVIAAHEADLVAVEAMGGWQPAPGRFLDLQRTAVVAGMLVGLAHPKPTFTLPANAPGALDSWRYRLTGVKRARDADVRRALLRALPDLPRSDEHVRDAAGLAVVALRVHPRLNLARAGNGG